MSNMNTVAGFYNLPAISVALTTAQVVVVPASGYAGLPSPVLISGAGLSIAPPPDIAGGPGFDGRAFKLRVAGVADTSGASSTIIHKLYQVNAAAVGVISAAGSVTSAGVVGTGTNLLFTSATIAASAVACVSFVYEHVLLWDSKGKSLSSSNTLQHTNFTSTSTFTTPAVNTAVASLNYADLNFEMVFTFSAATSNKLTINEFTLERL